VNPSSHWPEASALRVLAAGLNDPIIVPGNVYNMDETGVLLSVLKSLKVLVGKDDLRNCRGVRIKRTLVTAIECISADGRSLVPLIIWPAATHRSTWTTHPTPGWHFACTKTGYTDTATSLYWIKHVFHPLTVSQANHKPRVLINDGFGTHESLESMKFCYEHNIILCRLPSHTSHKLQPCDVGVFGPLKTAYREQVEQLYRGGANVVGKQHFTSLYSRARSVAFTPRNIRSGWSKTGLYPFNPDRVLKDIQKPPVDDHLPRTNRTTPGFSQQGDVLQTPVTSESLASLRNQVEQEHRGLDGRGRIRLQKLGNAAEKAFAERALLLHENRQLFTQNNERRSRLSTRSTVIGQAKVMSYEDIVEAQRKREVNGANRAGCNSKRKKPASMSTRRTRSRKEELEEGKREIEALGMGGYCSVLQI
jgi:hypothetical protein